MHWVFGFNATKKQTNPKKPKKKPKKLNKTGLVEPHMIGFLEEKTKEKTPIVKKTVLCQP
jgi:hypothetical protein